MKPVNSIDRSFQNQKNEVNETDVPKSGFNLSYRNHLGGLALGRLYPQSIQHLMPNDKISGSNEANLTFERLSTPVIDDVDVCVHNFLVTLRSIDNRWEKFMTPTKLNNMNNGVSVPTFDMKEIIRHVILWISYNFISTSILGGNSVIIVRPVNLSTFNLWDFCYHSDSVHDLSDQVYSILGSREPTKILYPSNNDDLIKIRLVFTAILDFFIGKRCLLDYLGYISINHNQIDKYLDVIFNSRFIAHYNVKEGNSPKFTFDQWCYDSDNFALSSDSNFVFTTGSSSSPTEYVLQNEYALRAYYAIWFEYYRNYDLEPRSNSLPEYHDFGGSSIFDTYLMKDLHFLIPRIRSWQQDAFTTAGIDDISRHVFAPILTDLQLDATKLKDSAALDLQSPSLDNTLVEQTIQWRDPSTGELANVKVPMPSRMLSTIYGNNTQTIRDDDFHALELFSLRKAQMLENYLKRIYYGGDEYRDRMLHLYGARIEDYRINRPMWLSSSLDMVSPRQEVANTGIAADSDATGVTPIGSRIATATGIQGGSDGFTEFCPEFGVFISILSIMPHASYDPLLMQNLQVKYSDFPIPQFANSLEDVISSLEISRSSKQTSFGFSPYAHAYRYRVDEIHGDYHDDKYDYCFLRFFDDTNVPNLSWSFIHCRPKLPMFVNSILLDGQVYGTFKHNFLVERALPSPIETI